ncbi:MAG: transglycosylase SLT domain-containing protein, partial [Actinocrinis sp.]
MLALGLCALGIVVALLVVRGGGALPAPGPAPIVDGAGPGDPFAYRSAQESQFVARATVGNVHVLFAKSPGGVPATAARVAAWRPAIDRAVAGTGISARLLEGLVFVESAGRPEAIAGSDPANAAGLTQILAQTGQSLLGMHIDLAASRRLTRQIDAIPAGTAGGAGKQLRRLLARRAAIDDRFDPRRALAATVRYLEIARRHFGRIDL